MERKMGQEYLNLHSQKKSFMRYHAGAEYRFLYQQMQQSLNAEHVPDRNSSG